jgi:hypothetical protein
MTVQPHHPIPGPTGSPQPRPRWPLVASMASGWAVLVVTHDPDLAIAVAAYVLAVFTPST